DVSWALSVHYGVDAVPIDDARIRDVAVEVVQQDYRPAGRVAGSGPVFLLADTGQEGLLAARTRLAAFDLEIAEAAFSVGRRDYPAGSWILRGRDGLAEALEDVAQEFALEFASVRSAPDVARHAAPV